MNKLFYGDNLDILRDSRKIKDESVDLCYIDPPFNSKRNYNQIYGNIASQDRAQAQIFIDTWRWDDLANAGLTEILGNSDGRFTPELIELIKGLKAVLGSGSLLAYLISMSLRLIEIWRVLKPNGSFYLHCDPTASHYLKLILDSIFCSQGGEFQNELIWGYSIGGKSRKTFGRKHDVIFFYTKGNGADHTFNEKGALIPRKANSHMRVKVDEHGEAYQEKTDRRTGKVYRYAIEAGKIAEDYWTDIQSLNREDRERQGYPTQKPEALLERIIRTSSNEGDVVLDAYCGCGTTVAVAQKLNRAWIGIDITYASISVILRRLQALGPNILESLQTDGIPRDLASAQALATKKDDRLRKEFEKWAVLTYTSNRARINSKKGADAGIDGVGFFLTAKNENAKIVFQVKSGGVQRGDIATLRGDMAREEATLAVLITLREPSSKMIEEAKAAGQYRHTVMGKNYDVIQIVTAENILDGKRLDIPLAVEVLKAATGIANDDEQLILGIE